MEPNKERRRRANRELESIVNVGIAYKNALGADVARDFYGQLAVAPAIVARVLAPARQRRHAPADTLVADRYADDAAGDASRP